MDSVILPLGLAVYTSVEIGPFATLGAATVVFILQNFFELRFLYTLLISYLLARVFAHRVAPDSVELMPAVSYRLAVTLGATLAFTTTAIAAMTGNIEPWHAVAVAMVFYYAQGRLSKRA